MSQKVTLYFYRNHGDTYASNKMPKIIGSQPCCSNDDGTVEAGICDDGVKVFGIEPLDKDGQVAKVEITVDSVELGAIVTTFTPFAKVEAKADGRAKRRRG